MPLHIPIADHLQRIRFLAPIPAADKIVNRQSNILLAPLAQLAEQVTLKHTRLRANMVALPKPLRIRGGGAAFAIEDVLSQSSGLR